MGAELNRVGLSLLLCGAGARVCGLPLEHVIETMRPLPLEVIPDLPPFMTGVSIIRGAAVPVVELRKLLGDVGTGGGVGRRLVLLRTGERRVALSVDAVLGIRSLEGTSSLGLPPLLQAANAAFVSAIGTLDSSLLVVLETGRLVPSAAWDALRVRSAQA